MSLTIVWSRVPYPFTSVSGYAHSGWQFDRDGRCRPNNLRRWRVVRWWRFIVLVSSTTQE